MAKTERPMTGEERMEFEGLLSGTKTETVPSCLKCGERTNVKSRGINSSSKKIRWFIQTTTALCSNDNCNAVFAQASKPKYETYDSVYGKLPVTFVDDEISKPKEFPMNFTDRQRTRAQEMLDRGMVPA